MILEIQHGKVCSNEVNYFLKEMGVILTSRRSTDFMSKVIQGQDQISGRLVEQHGPFVRGLGLD